MIRNKIYQIKQKSTGPLSIKDLYFFICFVLPPFAPSKFASVNSFGSPLSPHAAGTVNEKALTIINVLVMYKFIPHFTPEK